MDNEEGNEKEITTKGENQEIYEGLENEDVLKKGPKDVLESAQEDKKIFEQNMEQTEHK